MIVAPPNESTSPSVAIPLSVYSLVAALPAISTWSPTPKPSSSAEALSITAWSSAARRPALDVGERVEALGDDREAEARGAVAPARLAVGADDRDLLVGDPALGRGDPLDA